MRLTVLVLYAFCVALGGTATVDDVKRLRARANSSNYDKWIRPIKNQTNALEVTLGLILYSIIYFDQPKEALLTSVQLLVHWKDELLAWEKDDYGGITGLHFPQDEIWKPDLRLNNSYKSFTGFGSADLTLWVTYDGNVTWYPIQALESQCSVNTKEFPLDTQSCSLFFESACYHASQLKLLREGEDALKLTYYTTNSAWNLKSTFTVEHEPRAVEFKLVLKRRPGYFIINIFLPVAFLTALVPCTYMFKGERSGFAMTLFLAFSVFLTNVASQLPQNSEEIPHLSNYIVTLSFFGCLNVFICLLQTSCREGMDVEDRWLLGIYLSITIFITFISYMCAGT